MPQFIKMGLGGTGYLGSKELHLRKARMNAKRRKIEIGYPITTPFATVEDVRHYLSGDKIVCLLCGQSYRRIGTHLLSIHQVTPDQYREMYNIPWTYGLLCADSEKLYSDSAKKSGLGQNVDLQEISSLRKSAPVRMCPFKKEIARENVSKVPKRLRVFDAGVTKRGTSEFHERMKNRPQVAASIERLKTYWKGKKQDPEHIKKRISKMLTTKAALKLGKT